MNTPQQQAAQHAAIDINKTYTYRNGEPARILCVDAPGDFPVVAVCLEGVTTHLRDGENRCDKIPSQFDLIETPRVPREWDGVTYAGGTVQLMVDDEDYPQSNLQVRVREVLPDPTPNPSPVSSSPTPENEPQPALSPTGEPQSLIVTQPGMPVNTPCKDQQSRQYSVETAPDLPPVGTKLRFTKDRFNGCIKAREGDEVEVITIHEDGFSTTTTGSEGEPDSFAFGEGWRDGLEVIESLHLKEGGFYLNRKREKIGPIGIFNFACDTPHRFHCNGQSFCEDGRMGVAAESDYDLISEASPLEDPELAAAREAMPEGWVGPVRGPLKETTHGVTKDIRQWSHSGQKWLSPGSYGNSHPNIYALRAGSPIAIANGFPAPVEEKGIERWNFIYNSAMKRSETGLWVRYADHIAAMNARTEK